MSQGTNLPVSNITNNPSLMDCPQPYVSFDTNYTNIINNSEDLFTHQSSPYITDIKEIKDKVLEILLNKSDIDSEEYNEENYDNPEIDELCNKIDNLNQSFKVIQEGLNQADNNLKGEIKKMNKNIDKLNDFIEFIQKIDNNNGLNEDIDDLMKKISLISSKISKNESFIEAKKQYIRERKKIQKYIYLFRKINKWNVTNLCTICLTDPVEIFLNPCGHTFCKKCINQHFNIDDITNFQAMTTHNSKTCLVCRSNVLSVKPLYFL
ncbi:MAG: hypothetical protein CMH79_05855 [Nitrospinae bacterium]|nr:hypothetical protein [Nitrospinota bacterium]